MSDASATAGLATRRRYLRQFDLYRFVAFVAVIAQHAVLWPVAPGSTVGWGIVMVLHATREVFFFLSAFVAAYSQLLEPRPFPEQWVRRIGRVLVPYLAWTLVYFCYTLAASAGPVTAGNTLGHDVVNGYYQLYFLLVLLGLYVVLPGLVWLVRRTRGHHGLVFGVSLALQLAMMTLSHYVRWRTGAPGALRAVDLVLIDSRYVTGYQLYVVAGVLAADHLEEVQRTVERHSAGILWAVGAVGLAAEGYYAYGLAAGQNPGHASDLFQPVAVVWFLAACAGLWALGWRWAARSARSPAPSDRLVRWGSDASGGFYLAHVLVLQLVLSGLRAAGFVTTGTWWATSVVLFVATLAGTGLLVAALLRSPLRRWLTGPDRARERAALPPYPPVAVPSAPATAAATASAIAR